MHIREYILKNPEGRVEGIFKKSIRHLLTGFDKETLRRGWHYYKIWLKSRKVDAVFFREIETINDFAGEKNVNVFYYSANEKNSEENIAVTEFPPDATFRYCLIDEDKIDHIRRKSELPFSDSKVSVTNALIDLVPNAICGVIGPTRFIGGLHPNNGFFTKGQGVIKPFVDTNPIGQRRGAIAINSKGIFSILTEEEKLKARSTNFEGFEMVSGTSFYFTSDDSSSKVELMGQSDTSMCHYLVSYEQRGGKRRIAVFSAIRLVNRKQVKQFLDQHAKNHGWVFYIAAETELNGGGVFFRDDVTVLDHELENVSTRIKQSGVYPTDSIQWNRSDQYFICRN